MQSDNARAAVRILESTLRDGTYEIDFQLAVENTAFLAAALDRAGFSYIEVCHGVGAGSERWSVRPPGPRPFANDEAHIAAAAAVVERAQLVALVVAGQKYTPMDELDRLHALGVRVMRLAFEWQDVANPGPLAYINHAKKLGFTVAVNLMQTYNVPIHVLSGAVREIEARGADWFFVVDSAGSMTPVEVSDYVRAVLDATQLEVGLHAHNNGGLAIANSLAAIAAGATLVDTTLQGIGRATGNPSTEQMLLHLQKLGHEQDVDRELTMRLGDLARSLFAEKGNDPTHFTSGAARVHSRNVRPLMNKARALGQPEREFMFQVGQSLVRRGKPYVEEEVMAEIESGLALRPQVGEVTPRVFEIVGCGIERAGRGGLVEASELLFSRSKKRRKQSALYVAPAAQLFFGTAQPWTSGQLVGVTLPVGPNAALDELPADRVPDVFAYDPSVVDAPTVARVRSAHHIALPLSLVIADATVELALLLGAGRPISLRGTDAVGAAVELRLRERGVLIGETEAKVLVCARLTADVLASCQPGIDVIVYGRGDERGAVIAARKRGARVMRPLLAPIIAARIEASMALQSRLSGSLEAHALFGVEAVDPIMAPGGREIVVDDLTHPTTLLDCDSEERPRAALEMARQLVASWTAGNGPF